MHPSPNGDCIIRMSPRIFLLLYVINRFCVKNQAKGRAIPDPSLEVAERFRGMVLLPTIGCRFKTLNDSFSGLLAAGGPTSPKGIKPRSQLYTTKSSSWRLALWSATSSSLSWKKNICLKQLYNVPVSVCREMIWGEAILGIQPPKTSLFLFVESRGAKHLAKRQLGIIILGPKPVQDNGSGRQTDRLGCKALLSALQP